MTQSLYKRSNLTEYTSRAHHGCQITVYKWKHPRSYTPCNALQVMSGRQLWALQWQQVICHLQQWTPDLYVTVTVTMVILNFLLPKF